MQRTRLLFVLFVSVMIIVIMIIMMAMFMNNFNAICELKLHGNLQKIHSIVS